MAIPFRASWLLISHLILACRSISTPAPLVRDCPESDPALDPVIEGAVPRSPAPGLWSYQPLPVDPELEALASIGYVDGSEPPPTTVGVTVHDRQFAGSGWNLFSSGEGPVAILMDMDGKEIHRWSRPFHEIWPEREVDDRRSEHQYWRRVHWLPGGDLLVIVEGHGIVRLNWNSEVVWAWGGGAHHDMEVLANGDIWVLSRRARYRTDLHEKPILEDYATRLGPHGCPKQQISLLDAVLKSDARILYERSESPAGDVFHTNTLSVIDSTQARRHPAFKPGHLLLSLRTLSALVVLDPKTSAVVWWHQGDYREQHDAEVLTDGSLLMFDNLGPPGLPRKQSAVRQFALPEMREIWRYDGTPSTPLYSRYLGAAQRLNNGNTLITESGPGRAIEITPQGEVVWAFQNPERAGKNNAYVAILPEMIRIPKRSLH